VDSTAILLKYFEFQDLVHHFREHITDRVQTGLYLKNCACLSVTASASDVKQKRLSDSAA